MEELKVIGGMCNFPWLIAHKVDIFFDVFNVLNIFFSWVGIVKSQIAFSFADSSLHEVESHGFAVTYMKVAVGLRWESSQNNISEFGYPILK